MKKSALSLAMLLFTLSLSAQDIEMADQLRADGKIYVVIGVLLILLFGILAYLIRLDIKLKKLENKKD